MKKIHGLLAIVTAMGLAGCQENRIENVQAEAENQSQRLEARANEIAAEAENSVNDDIRTLDNEADALLDQAAPANVAEGGNSAR